MQNVKDNTINLLKRKLNANDHEYKGSIVDVRYESSARLLLNWLHVSGVAKITWLAVPPFFHFKDERQTEARIGMRLRFDRFDFFCDIHSIDL